MENALKLETVFSQTRIKIYSEDAWLYHWQLSSQSTMKKDHALNRKKIASEMGQVINFCHII